MRLQLEGVSKSYGKTIGLYPLDLMFSSGIIAVVGANGSGKSTLLQLLATLITPDTGTMHMQGLDYSQHRDTIRRMIGYVPQDIQLPHEMRVESFLHYLCKLRHTDFDGDVLPLIEQLRLHPLLTSRIGQLSGGQQQMIAILQAVMDRPRLLLIDELFKGLSFDERRLVRVMLQQICRKCLLIFSTHLPDELDAFAERVLLLHKHRMLAYLPIDDFRQQAAGQVHQVRMPFDVIDTIQGSLAISKITRDDGTAVCRIIGTPLPDYPAESVLPTIADAYLWLLSQAKNHGVVDRSC